jgi:hypothetical protein
MDPLGIGAIVAIVVLTGFIGYIKLREYLNSREEIEIRPLLIRKHSKMNMLFSK